MSSGSTQALKTRSGGEAAESLLGLPAIALDPGSHEIEHLCLEVSRPALGILAAADQSGIFEHLEMLGHRLNRDVVRSS